MKTFLAGASFAVAALFGVVGCANEPPAPPPISASSVPFPVAAPPIVPTGAPVTTTSAKSTTTAPRAKVSTTTRTKAADSYEAQKPKSDADVSYRCTNRIDYSGDPRDNATINSIGAETGRCPKPQRATTSGEAQYVWGCQQGYITQGC